MTITRDAAPASTTAPTRCRAWASARARVDAALDQLGAAIAEHVGALADPLAVAGWARQAEARIASVRMTVLAEADRRGAARKVGALGTAAWLSGQGVAPGSRAVRSPSREHSPNRVTRRRGKRSPRAT